MQKEINFYQEMASEHRLQENSKGPVPLCQSLIKVKIKLQNIKKCLKQKRCALIRLNVLNFLYFTKIFFEPKNSNNC